MESVKIRAKPFWVALATLLFVICCDGYKIIFCLTAFAVILYHHPATRAELQLACWDFLAMEAKATSLLVAMRSVPAAQDEAFTELDELKRNIKHRQVPSTAITALFNLIDYAISSTHYADAGFSILGHLTKRLILQEQKELLISQGLETLPSIVDSLGDRTDRIRQRATQALSDFWHLSAMNVEQIIRDTALTSKIPKVKEAGMKWILKIRKEHDIQFKSFVPGIIDCLEDSDESVRETAKATIVGLFRSVTNDRAKYDLQKGLRQHDISQDTVVQVLTQLGVAIPAELDSTTSTKPQATSTARPPPVPSVTSQIISRTKPQVLSTSASQSSTESKPVTTTNNTPQTNTTPHAQEVGPSKKIETSHKRVTSDSLPPVVITSAAEREAEKLDPAYVETTRDLEDIFRDMQPHFEGKESEQNWSAREKSVIKLRKITKGNATGDFTTAYLVGIKSLLDGILKTINSLRTTVSTNGCHLIQDIARVAGSGLDNMVEILLPNLIKLCANTKKISASNGNITVDTILANVSYNIRLVQHIWNACQDKNVQPRTFATGWLKTIITKYGQRKSVLEHGGGLDLIEKCIKAGLADRDKKVRESMRPTYWAFARICSEKSEHILASLEKKQQDLLIEDPSNPNPQKAVVADTSMVATRTPALSRSTTSVPAARPSLKETIAAQKKRANLPDTRLPDRPGSADSAISLPKTKPSSSTVRPATAVGSLSSAPVRPFRMTKKPDAKRQTAISRPYAPADLSSSHSLPADKTTHSYDAAELLAVEVPPELATVEAPMELPAVETSTELPAAEVPVVQASIAVDPVETYPINKYTFMDTMIDAIPSNKVASAEARSEETLKVFEDPLPKSEMITPPGLFPSPNVLEELPVNKTKSNSLESEGKSANMPGKNINVVSGRRLLDSGIVRVRARTLDIYGFRKLQGLIRNQDDIWGDGAKFEELLLPLLETLEEPNDESKPAKALDLKTQVLVTVQLMLKHQPKFFSTFYPRALCAILSARNHFQSTSHIVYDLGETYRLIAQRCEPEDCINAVLDLLETETSEIHESSTLFMGMSVLESLLYRYAVPKSHVLTNEQEVRMGKLATRCLAANNPDIRRAVLQYVLMLNDCMSNEHHIWKLLGPACEDYRDLITYYIAKREETKVRI